jgi:hypothetical protein
MIDSRAVMMTIAVSIATASCGGASGPGAPGDGAGTTSGSGSPTPGGTERWLAAVEVAPRADDLDRATDRLRDVLGPALVVSPVDCFDGLPPEAGDDGYVIGALTDSAVEAQGLLEAAGEEPLFTASVTIVCPD